MAQVDVQQSAEDLNRDNEALEDLADVDGEAMDEDESNPMAALLASARARASQYEEDPEDPSDDEMDQDDSEGEWAGLGEDDDAEPNISAPASRKDSSRKAFDKVFKNVVEALSLIHI